MGEYTGRVKYGLFIFNFCLWLLGCALLAVGIWMKMDDSAKHYVTRLTDKVDGEYRISYSATGDDDLTVTLAYLLIGFGIVLIVVTFIGCCGAVRENVCMLAVFSVCLFVLMAILIAIGAWALVAKGNVNAHTDDLRKKTNQNLLRAIKMYHLDDSSKNLMNNVQERFQCCGFNNSRSYDGVRMPDTCRRDNYNRGCAYYYFSYVGDEIEEFLLHRYSVIAGISIGVALCLLFGMVISILLCCIIYHDTRLVVT